MRMRRMTISASMLQTVTTATATAWRMRTVTVYAIQFEVAGCQDDMACNYDADATDPTILASMLQTVTTATATACRCGRRRCMRSI